MMKKWKLQITVFSILFVVSFGSLVLVSAQGGDNILFNTSWTFQNLASDTANVNAVLQDVQGNVKASQSFTIAASVSFWAPDYVPLTDPSFNGSIVTMGDKPLASISNQVAANSTSGKTGNATYRAINSELIAPVIYVPVVMKNFGGKYWTELSIQSVASSGSTMVKVHYFDEDGNEVSGSPINYTAQAGSAVRVAQKDEAILPDGFIGSVTVETADGTTPVAVVVNEFVGVSTRMYDEFYSYEGFKGGATRIVLPAVFVNGYGGTYQSSTSVQNLSGPNTPATVTWRFYDTTPGNPNASTEIYTFTEIITTSKSVYFPDAPYVDKLLGGYVGPGSLLENEWVGAITLESGQPLVAIVNELNFPYHAASYVGFSKGNNELFFPLAFVKAYGFANTSFSIADMSGNTTTPVSVTVEYIADKTQCPLCSDTTDTYSFNNIDSRYQPTHLNEEALKAALDPNGVFVGSIRITANKPINGIMNEIVGDFNMDNFTSFNAFTLP